MKSLLTASFGSVVFAVLLAFGMAGTVQAQASGCTVSSFYAQPSSVAYGESTTLVWNLAGNCVNASISGIGTVNPTGAVSTGALTYSTYYTLAATDGGSGQPVTSQIFVGVTGASGTTTGGSGQLCAVTSLSVSPSTVTSGQSATLRWTANGCTAVTVSGGSLTSEYAPLSGTMSTGPVYGTTTFTISGNGPSGSTSASTTLSVTNSQYPYSYTCQPGGYSNDPSCNTQYSSNFVTTPATNVGATTARMNGLALNTPDNFSAYFEYGTTPSLGRATSFQSLGNVTSFNVYQTLNTTPSTTYYYRIAAQVAGGPTIRGNILSFTTLQKDNVVYASDTNSGSNSSSSNSSTGSTTGGGTTNVTNSSTNGVLVTVTSPGDKVAVKDTTAFTITYTNDSGKTITDSVLTIVLPQGFTIKQTTQGTILNPSTISINLGTLAPKKTGSVYVEATVGPNTMVDTTLVTSATLSYTLPNGTHDSSVGYVLNHATATSSFGGLALGTGFFPSTLFGWFMTIIIILIIILIARRVAKQKHGGDHGGHGGAHH